MLTIARQFIASRLSRQPHTRHNRRSPSQARRTRRLRLESLEDRRMLALTVDTLVDESDGDYSAGDFSLREAMEIANANPGADEINFDPDLAGGSIGLMAMLPLVTDDLTIVGLGDGTLTIDGARNRVFQIASGVTAGISDVTITGGRADTGGGILNYGDLTVRSSTLLGNAATNTGGAISNFGTLSVVGSYLRGNAAGTGGAISNIGELHVLNSRIMSNDARGNGGAISNALGTLSVTGSILSENAAGDNGGAIHNAFNGTVSLQDVTVSGNQARDGGGLWNGLGSVATVAGSQLTSNRALYTNIGGGGDGGGIWNAGLLEVAADSRLAANDARWAGGGIYNAGSGMVTVDDSSVEYNQTELVGGGIYNFQGGTVSISNYSTLRGNTTFNLGAGIYNGGELNVVLSTLSGNVAQSEYKGGHGGGVYNAGDASFVNANFRDNYAYNNGGGIYNDGAMEVSGSLFENNEAWGGYGGGIYNTNQMQVGDSTIISDNRAHSGGGIANSAAATATVASTMLWHNDADASGGGIHNEGALDVSFSQLDRNEAGGWGGGIWNAGQLSVTHQTVVSRNSAGLNGGGILNDGTLQFYQSDLVENSAGGEGGGIYNAQGRTAWVVDSLLQGNSSTGGLSWLDSAGGAIANYGAMKVHSSDLVDNTAGEGGGIANRGSVIVSDSTLSANSAIDGGGIHNNGTLTVLSSTLSHNRAGLRGGGILNAGDLIVTGSTLSGNSAWGPGGGIFHGLFDGATGTATITNSTLTLNRAGGGGGLAVADGVAVFSNSIVAGNLRGSTSTTNDITGQVSGFFNLIGDGTGMSGIVGGINGNQVGAANAPIDPMLGSLQDNGGPTLTHGLLSGSPALDAGIDAAGAGEDQRGFSRPVDMAGVANARGSDGTDIGAFERQAFDTDEQLGGITVVFPPLDSDEELNPGTDGIPDESVLAPWLRDETGIAQSVGTPTDGFTSDAYFPPPTDSSVPSLSQVDKSVDALFGDAEFLDELQDPLPTIGLAFTR